MSWPLVELRDVAPSKPIKNPEILNEENTWQLNLDKIESGSGVITEKVYGSVQSAGSSTHWFDKRHVLYSKLRPYLNKVVLPDMQGLATTELVPLCPDHSRLDRKFLAYYLRSSRFVNWISDQVAGAKMPRVSMKVFWEHKIPLPPLAEQKRIASILDKADGIRRKRQQAIDLADEFLRSVFLDMFGDPVSNPKGWEIKAISQCLSDGDIESIQDGNHGNDHPKVSDFSSNGVPFIAANVVRKGKILFDKCYYLDPSWLDKLRIGFARPRDVLLSHKGTLGLTAVLDDTFDTYIFSPQTTYYRLNDNKILPEYLKAYFDSKFFQRLMEKARLYRRCCCLCCLNTKNYVYCSMLTLTMNSTIIKH